MPATITILIRDYNFFPLVYLTTTRTPQEAASDYLVNKKGYGAGMTWQEGPVKGIFTMTRPGYEIGFAPTFEIFD